MALTTQQILLNGRAHSVSSAVVSIKNRAFEYGDCISETVHACAGRLCFFGRHIDNLITAMELAGMTIPVAFKPENRAALKDEISKLLVRNKVFKGANVKITVFRSGNGEFFAKNSDTEYAVGYEPLTRTGFEFNADDGVWITVYDKFPKPVSPLWNYDTHENFFLKHNALQDTVKERVNDMVLVNSDGNWVQSVLYGNIFLKVDKVIYTPPLKDGAPNDVFRGNVIETCQNMGLQVETEKSIGAELVAKADEIFFASTASGVLWVSAYKKRRFFRKIGQTVADKINSLYLNLNE